LPPVDDPPVVFDEQPQTTVAPANTAASADNRAIAVRGLLSAYRFVTGAFIQDHVPPDRFSSSEILPWQTHLIGITPSPTMIPSTPTVTNTTARTVAALR